MKKIIFLLALSICFFQFATGQVNGPLTLQEQFHEITSDVSVVENYRMVKAFQVEQFWKSVNDSINAHKQAVDEARTLLASEQEEVNHLREVITSKETSTAALEFAGDHITVMGMDYSKKGFISAITVFAIVLFLAIGALIFLNRNSHHGKRETSKLYEETYQEFESYKHNAVEKQIKLSREILDYQNIINGMTKNHSKETMIVKR